MMWCHKEQCAFELYVSWELKRWSKKEKTICIDIHDYNQKNGLERKKWIAFSDQIYSGKANILAWQ